MKEGEALTPNKIKQKSGISRFSKDSYNDWIWKNQ